MMKLQGVHAFLTQSTKCHTARKACESYLLVFVCKPKPVRPLFNSVNLLPVVKGMQKKGTLRCQHLKDQIRDRGQAPQIRATSMQILTNFNKHHVNRVFKRRNQEFHTHLSYGHLYDGREWPTSVNQCLSPAPSTQTQAPTETPPNGKHNSAFWGVWFV